MYKGESIEFLPKYPFLIQNPHSLCNNGKRGFGASGTWIFREGAA